MNIFPFSSSRENKPDDYSIIKDLAYVSGGAERQQGDLFLPKGEGPHPTAVVIHGGGWIRRDRSDMKKVAARLAVNGIAAFNINYRLAPQNRYPAQLNDTHAALRFLKQNAVLWALNSSAFATVGYSAGAHLALLAAQLLDPEGPKIRAVIAGGTPVDFSLYPRSPFITRLIGGSPSEFPEQWRQASPIQHVTRDHPPVFLYHGQWDIIVQIKNAKMLQSALREVDVPVELDVRYFQGHRGVASRQNASIEKGILFLKKHLNQRSPLV